MSSLDPDGTYRPSSFDWVRDQVDLYERTDGREGGEMDGRRVIILTTVGRRSGAVRKSPLMRLESGGVYAVVGSVGGLPANPAWYHNLKAQPRCRVQDGADVHELIAHEANSEERSTWWPRAVTAFPHYAELQEGSTRQFPVMLLERVTPDTRH